MYIFDILLTVKEVSRMDINSKVVKLVRKIELMRVLKLIKSEKTDMDTYNDLMDTAKSDAKILLSEIMEDMA